MEVEAQTTFIPVTVSPIDVSTSTKLLNAFPKRMLDVFRCESGLKQFESDGTVVLSPTLDVGIAQINLKTWLKKSQLMGLDIINSQEDNLKMAKWIYDNVGEQAWVCSRLI